MTDHDVLAVPAGDAAGEAAMKDWAEMLVDRARAQGVELTGVGTSDSNHSSCAICGYGACGSRKCEIVYQFQSARTRKVSRGA